MKRVLLIEDADEVRELIKIYLTEMGHEVFATGKGRDGLEIYQDLQPDLVMTDIILPDISGFDIIKMIRLTDQKVPIFVLSVYMEELHATEHLGVYATIPKPPEYHDLEKLIHSCLAKESE